MQTEASNGPFHKQNLQRKKTLTNSCIFSLLLTFKLDKCLGIFNTYGKNAINTIQTLPLRTHPHHHSQLSPLTAATTTKYFCRAEDTSHR